MIGKPKFGTLSQYLTTHPMLMYEKWEWEGNPPPLKQQFQMTLAFL